MQDNQILTDLAARLEAAPEGSPELDRMIGEALRIQPHMATRGDATRVDQIYPAWLPYTTSTEAALSLWDTPDIGRGYPRRGINLFYAVLPGGKMAWAATAWELKDGNLVILHVGEGQHRSRPLSACIAAIKGSAT